MLARILPSSPHCQGCVHAGAWCCTCSKMSFYWLLTTRFEPINESSPFVCCNLCYRWDLVPTLSPLSMGPNIRAMYRSPQVLRGALRPSSLPMRYCSIHTGVSAVLRVVLATAQMITAGCACSGGGGGEWIYSLGTLPKACGTLAKSCRHKCCSRAHSATRPDSSQINLFPHMGCFAAAVQSWPWRVQLDAS